MSLNSNGAAASVKPLFSLLFWLHLLQPSLLYSFKTCSADPDDDRQIDCSFRNLSFIPDDVPKTATVLSVNMSKIHVIRRSGLVGFTSLKLLDLAYNTISHIEDRAFTDLTALRSLLLLSNQLTNLTDHMFMGLSNLSTLSLHQNKIVFISKLAFEPLRKLHTLDLSANAIHKSDVANIASHCPSLEFLNLGFNKLTVLQSSALSFPSIKELNLAGNNLTLFDTETCPFVLLNLTNLDLSSNPLRRVRLRSDVLPRLHSLSMSSLSESVIEWDVADKTFLRNLAILSLSETDLTIETYKLLFQIVDSVESLDLFDTGGVLDEGLLDFACRIPSLRTLDLQSNDIVFLNESLLRSCTNLTKLDLSLNSMTDLAESSFQTLTHVTELTFDFNELSRIPAAIRNMKKLKSLSLKFNHIEELQCSDFMNLLLLLSLSVYGNQIYKIKSCVFINQIHLKSLDLGSNHLLQLDNTFDVAFPFLESLYLPTNLIVRLHKGVFQNVSSLSHLDLESLTVTSVEPGAFEGLHSLKWLSLSIYSPEKGVFSGLFELEELHLFTQLSAVDPIFNLPSLQILEITVTNDACLLWPQDVFKGLDNLRRLKSQKFCFTPFYTDMFRYTPHLKTIHSENNFEFHPIPELFHPLTELEVLHLPLSNVQSLAFLSNANLTKLVDLDLRYNLLSVINESVFASLPSLKYLDLSGNPFVCDCSNAGFIEWAIRNKQVQVVGAYQYTCSSPSSEEGHFLLDFNVQSCWEFTGFLCFICSSALVLLTLLSSFIFHFLRWQLVYGYYLLLAFLYDSKKRRQGCPHIYDAFVSYNVHDEDWVYGELLPELEGRQGWRLCLHHRDFLPGKPIIENITDAIYSSRKTLCVISRRYLQSEWCSREIQLASFRLFDEQKDVLVLLFLEELSSNQLSPFYRMRKLVKRRTYLSWTQAQSHKGLFWERVHRALGSSNEPGDNHNPLTADI